MGLDSDATRTSFVDHMRGKIPRLQNYRQFQEGIDSFSYLSVLPTEPSGSDEFFLVFVGPSNKSSASVFGHLFLLERKGDLLTSPTYSYMADVSSTEGFVSYAVKGLSGGFNGVVVTEPFFKTIRRYAEIEDRHIFFFKLSEEAIDLSKLKEQLSSKDNSDSYRFLSNNCTSYLRRLLASASGSQLRPSSSADYPTDLLLDLRERRVIELHMVWPSNYFGFVETYHTTNWRDKREVWQCLKRLGEVPSDDCVLTTGSKRLMSAFYRFAVSKFESIEYLNAVSRNSDFGPAPTIAEPFSELEKWDEGLTRPRRLTASFGNDGFSKLRFRPSFQDRFDSFTRDFEFDSLELLTTDLESDGGDIHVGRFNTYSSETVRDFNQFDPAFSFKTKFLEFNDSKVSRYRKNLSNEIAIGVSRLWNHARASLFFSPRLVVANGPSLNGDLEFKFESEVGRRFKIGADLRSALWRSPFSTKESADFYSTVMIKRDFQLLAEWSIHQFFDEESVRLITAGVGYSF